MIYVHEFISTRFTSFSTHTHTGFTNIIFLKIYNFHLEIDYLYYLKTFTINFKSIYFYIFFLKNFNLWCLLLVIVFYHQTKTPIGIWCKWRLISILNQISDSETYSQTHYYVFIWQKKKFIYFLGIFENMQTSNFF